MRCRRIAGVLFAAFGLLVTATPIHADSRDIDAFDLPFLPCAAGVPDMGVPAGATGDGAFPHICFVRFGGAPGITAWQASTGEWILFHQRVAFGSQGQCLEFAAARAATVTLDGDQVAFDTLPCQQPAAPPGFTPPWIYSFRFLSHPLPQGMHTATLTFSGSGVPTTTLSQSVSVVAQG